MADVPPSSSRDKFDYEETKKKYMKQVEMYYRNRRVTMTSPYTRPVVDKIKELIKEGSALKSYGHPSEHAKYKVMNRYEVVEKDGKEILILKRKGDRPIIQVVPAEDSFDIIAEAHLETKHGGRDKMLEVIIQKYSIPKTSLEFVLAVCNVCSQCNNAQLRQKARNRIPPVLHSRGQVSIIDMTWQPDHEFKYILFYLDRFTKYMFLRPLMTKSEDEVAMELLKIFLDFGPPTRLETYDRIYFLKVLSLVNTVYENFNINLVLPVKVPDITSNDVEDMLQEWMVENNSHNWSIGCYMVQWKNNCTRGPDYKSPYEVVFHARPSFGVTNVHTHKKMNKTDEGVLDMNPGSFGSRDARDDIAQGDEKDLLSSKETENSEDDDDIIIITEPSDKYVPGIITQSAPSKFTVVIPTGAVGDEPTNRKQNATILSDSKQTDCQTDIATPSEPFKTQNKLVKIRKPGKSKDQPAPTNKQCHICKTEINKAYICMKCNRNVHLFCSDRLLQADIPLNVLDVTCTSCRLVNNRFENLKRKFHEMDK